MKKILTLLLLILVTVPGISQNRQLRTMDKSVETGAYVPSGPINTTVPSPVFQRGGTYPGSIPGTKSFFDYVTNGNNMANMWTYGDTLIVGYFGADSTDATGGTSRVAYYIVSTDAGVTWGSPLALTSLPRRSAYTFVIPYLNLGIRSIGLSGRLYTAPGPGATGGGAYADAFFGLGSISNTQVPNSNRDYWGVSLGGDIMGGIAGIAGGTSDTLNFWKYNMTTGLFTATTPVVLPEENDVSSRWHAVSSDNGHMIALWWLGTNGMEALKLKSSSDGGTTWSTATTIQQSFSTNGVINGDTCSPWFGIDAVYKPGTNDYYVAWNTLYPTGTGQSSGDPQGDKILFWGPNLNGGVAVEIAGRSNMNIVGDTNLLFPMLNLASPGLTDGGLQIGVTPVSHPSIAFSEDGSRIVCSFSGYQPIPDTLENYVMNDIYACYSDDGGLTWSAPENITNTADWDELYPTVSPTGNLTTKFSIHYQATRGPGCQSFNQTAYVSVYPVYQVHDYYEPPVGIHNISSEIPNGFSLKQNFPNPFNPSTSIQFSIPKSALVSLKVYDITGKEVATLVSNQQLAAGTFQYDFSAKNLASGMYFYTLSAGDYKETKKMILMK